MDLPCQPTSENIDMVDPNALFWTAKPPAARQPKPGERLFEFVRDSDGAPMSCELRFHGESYGWEVQLLERGDFVFGHGSFTMRSHAVRYAERLRDDLAGIAR